MHRVGDNVRIVKSVAKYTNFLSYVQRHMSYHMFYVLFSRWWENMWEKDSMRNRQEFIFWFAGKVYHCKNT